MSDRLRRIRIVGLALLGLVTLRLATAHGLAPTDVLLYEDISNQWFEGPSGAVRVSDDGQWALFSRAGVLRLASLTARREDPQRLRGSLDVVRRAAFCGGGNLARFGQRGSVTGWFLPAADDTPAPDIPDDAQLRCSADGRVVVYTRASRPDEIVVGPSVFDTLGGRVTSVAVSPGGASIFALVWGANGASSLLQIAVASGERKIIAADLDADPNDSGIAIAADGRSLYVPLATAGRPDNAQRHRPDAPRWLKLFDVNVATGARRTIVESSGHDTFAPSVAGGLLYWARNSGRTAVVLVSAETGAVKELRDAGELPTWSPDARRISYIVGGWRRADWALNLDAAVVRVNAQGAATSRPAVIVQGYHEDFSPAWSPDGRWIAYHSHRSSLPVAEYGGAGSADDIYLRRADDVRAPEIRLTNFGWEAGPASWSPDGRRLVFSSWVKGGQPGIHRLWVITIDPASGRVVDTQRLPLSAEIRSAQWTAWSPDGREIAIEDRRDGEQRRLWIVQADGTGARRVIDYTGTTYGGLDWTRDGWSLVYGGLAGETMQLFVVDRDGGASRQLTHDRANLLHPQVSPDGRWIACTRIVHAQQIWRR